MNSDHAKKTYQEAQGLFQQKKFAEALTLLNGLDAEFPNEPNIMFARARCLVALGQFDEARTICNYLTNVLGQDRGAQLLAQIDAHAAPASPVSAFDIPGSAAKSAAQMRLQQQRGGSKKKVILIGGAALAAVGIAAAAVFFFNGDTEQSKVAASIDLPLPDHPTYYKDVAPIFNTNCVVCHRPGEAVPMSLMSYDQVRPWAKSIQKMVDTRQMPPWHADPSIGVWENDRRLSDRDLTTIVRWVDQGVARGNPEEAPPTPKFTEGWKIGEPDEIFTADSQLLPAELEDEYRYVFVPTGFKEDRWISAAEVRPGNIDVVHHVIVFTADPTKGRSGGLGGSLGGFAPGSPPLIMDKGQGMKIEAGAVLVLQIHYHKEPGAMERDQTKVGLKFADQTIKKELRFGTLGTEKFVIPPHRAFHPVQASLVLDEDVHLEQIIPHMHLRGTDMKVWADLPNGRMMDLLSVPNYDFNWQTFYKLAKPVSLPKGTELNAYAHFDNSSDNPFNPDPSAEVRWGEPTTAEMMYAFFMYTVDDEKLKVKDPGT